MADTDRLVEVWRQIIEGDGKSWVLFEHGTCVVLAEPGADELAARAADELAAQAVRVLREFGPVLPGSPAADFGTIPLDRAPGWVVTGHHPDVLTYVAPGEVDEPDSLAVGLTGRSKRHQDAEDLAVIHVEDKGS